MVVAPEAEAEVEAEVVAEEEVVAVGAAEWGARPSMSLIPCTD